jgi:hypothetical protein
MRAGRLSPSCNMITTSVTYDLPMRASSENTEHRCQSFQIFSNKFNLEYKKRADMFPFGNPNKQTTELKIKSIK